MFLGRITGTVVATLRVPGLEGVRLLVVQPLEPDGRERGRPLVAADATQAGPGELVHLVTSREASMALPETFVPVDAAVVGIVDEVDLPAEATP